MDRSAGKPPLFNGTDYSYWKIRMTAYLQSINSRVWEICEDEHYEVLATHVGQEQIDQHEGNSKARNAIVSYLSPTKFDRVSHHATAREIWKTLEKYHEGTSHV